MGNPPEESRLLKMPEVARILAISPATAYRMVQAGELPAVRYKSGSVRIWSHDLLLFLEACRKNSMAENVEGKS